jgi:threonylcarbamoyladenosine tRNA methylthiotransferase MtaB
VKQVIEYGFKEIVITGVNLGRYDYRGTNFEDLIEKILEVPGDFRVRISSIEPEGFGDKLFSLFSHPKLMPHLHLCLQSGSDRILLQMRRFYNVATFMNMVGKIRGSYPDFNLTTDIIVGFPGETEADFEESCKIAREAAFSHIHTFKYSVRTGTRAARMDDQVPEEVKNERSRIIRDISEENKRVFRSGFIGKEQIVLAEKINKRTGLAKGYGTHYIPVTFKTSEHSLNRFNRVVIKGIAEGQDPVLQGELIEVIG